MFPYWVCSQIGILAGFLAGQIMAGRIWLAGGFANRNWDRSSCWVFGMLGVFLGTA